MSNPEDLRRASSPPPSAVISRSLAPRVGAAAGSSPPASDRGHGERGGVVVGADRDPAGVAAQVVHPVGVGLAGNGVDEVVHHDPFGVPARTPLAATVLVWTDELLLLGAHSDHRVPGVQVLPDLVAQVGELGIPIHMLTALDRLGAALQAESGSSHLRWGLGDTPGGGDGLR